MSKRKHTERKEFLQPNEECALLILAQQGNKNALLFLMTWYFWFLKKVAATYCNPKRGKGAYTRILDIVLSQAIRGTRTIELRDGLCYLEELLDYITTHIHEHARKEHVHAVKALLEYERISSAVSVFTTIGDSENFLIDTVADHPRHGPQFETERMIVSETIKKALQSLIPEDREIIHRLFWHEQTIFEIHTVRGDSGRACTVKKRARKVLWRLSKTLHRSLLDE